MQNEKHDVEENDVNKKKDDMAVLRAKSKLLLKALLFSFGIFFFTLFILFLTYLYIEKGKKSAHEDSLTPEEQKSEEALSETHSSSIDVGVEKKTETSSTNSTTSEKEVVKEDGVPVVVETKKPSQAKKFFFGMSLGETLSHVSEKELEETFDDLASLGVGWVRVDLAWSTIQRENKDAYAWAPFDRIVREANKRGMVVLPILTYTPAWARLPECAHTPKCEPRDPKEFAQFAKTAVERYAPQGVYAWEVWNEPNIRKFWANGASPWRYSRLLEETYKAIHTADTGAFVVSGGLAPTYTGNGNVTAREFLEGMYASGAGAYFDALGFHPYTFPLSPSAIKSTNAWSQMSETDWNLRGIMKANGDGYKEIWMTEVGAPTGGPKGAASNAKTSIWSTHDHVTEEYQAQILQEAVLMRQSYDWAGPLFWYSYKDLGTSTDTIENFFGIRRFDGTKKPSYVLLSTLLQTL